MLPDILTALKNESWEFKIEESRTISIFKEADITGDDAPEALIDLGSGGAYTAYLTLMRIENNKAVIARFQKKDGAISHLAFLNGSSAKNGVKTEFSGKDQSLYDMRWSANEQSLKIDTCTVEAYQWNGKTKIFEFNPDLSNKIKNDQCGKLQLNQ